MAGAWTITTGSRLHFGPLAWKPGRGRDFGGWGVMLETPRTVVRIGQIRPDSGHTPLARPTQARAETILRHLLSEQSWSSRTVVPIAVDEEPPAHCGFGTGTQLALAIAAGLAKLTSGVRPPATELARQVGRGLRSAVGIHGFDHGGLIVDAGKLPGDDIGLLAEHAEIPPAWRFVLVRPGDGIGLAGEQERAAFSDLPSFSESLTGQLQAIVFNDVLPSVKSGDCDRFAAALDDYGMLVGDAFRPAQGGVVHPQAMPIWTALRDHGLRGIAQTSWGPTLAAVCPDGAQAARVADLARELAPTSHVTISSPRNQGAELTPC